MNFLGSSNVSSENSSSAPSPHNENYENNNDRGAQQNLQTPGEVLAGILEHYSYWNMSPTEKAQAPPVNPTFMIGSSFRPQSEAVPINQRPQGSRSSTPDCVSGCSAGASARCLDCNEYMCSECHMKHQSSPINANHSFQPLPAPIGTSPLSDHLPISLMNNHICDFHSDLYRFVCETCDKLLCECCIYRDHSTHNYISIAAYIERAIEKLELCMKSSRVGIKCIKSTIDKALTLIRIIERNCTDVTENIRKSFRQFMIAIEDRERYWLEYVEKHRNRRLAMLQDQMAGLKSALAGLSETTDVLSKTQETITRMNDIDLALHLCNSKRQLEQFAQIHRDLQPRQELLSFTTPDYTLLGEIRNQGAITISDEGNIPFDPNAFMAPQPLTSTHLRRPIVRDNGVNRPPLGAFDFNPLFPSPFMNGNVQPTSNVNYHSSPSPSINNNPIAHAIANVDLNPMPSTSAHALASLNRAHVMPVNNMPLRPMLQNNHNNHNGSSDWEHLQLSPALQFGAPRVTQCIAGYTDHVKVRTSNCVSLSFAREGHEDGEVSRPWGICVDKMGNILVSDRRNNRVQVFSSDGIFKFKFGRKGVNSGEFDLPAGICTDCDNRIIVVDKDNHRVQIFTANGVFMNKFGSFGKEYGQFQYPWDVAVNSRRQIVVTDSRNHRIQQFDSEGRFIRQIVFDNNGMGKSIAAPRGVCYTPQGNIIVSDFDNHCLYLIDPDVNEIISSKGSEGCGFQEFNRPSGLCCDDDGRIIVADSKNQRIMVFSPSMDYLWDIEIRPSANKQMPCTLDERDRTCDVTLMPDGRILFLIELSPDSKEGSNPHKRFVHAY